MATDTTGIFAIARTADEAEEAIPKPLATRLIEPFIEYLP
jgi:hypothetical protein